MDRHPTEAVFSKEKKIRSNLNFQQKNLNNNKSIYDISIIFPVMQLCILKYRNIFKTYHEEGKKCKCQNIYIFLNHTQTHIYRVGKLSKAILQSGNNDYLHEREVSEQGDGYLRGTSAFSVLFPKIIQSLMTS